MKKVYLSINGEFETQAEMIKYLSLVLDAMKAAEQMNEPFHACAANDGKENKIKALSSKI